MTSAFVVQCGWLTERPYGSRGLTAQDRWRGSSEGLSIQKAICRVRVKRNKDGLSCPLVGGVCEPATRDPTNTCSAFLSLIHYRQDGESCHSHGIQGRAERLALLDRDPHHIPVAHRPVSPARSAHPRRPFTPDYLASIYRSPDNACICGLGRQNLRHTGLCGCQGQRLGIQTRRLVDLDVKRRRHFPATEFPQPCHMGFGEW